MTRMKSFNVGASKGWLLASLLFGALILLCFDYFTANSGVKNTAATRMNNAPAGSEYSEAMLRRFETLALSNPIVWTGNPYEYFAGKPDPRLSVAPDAVCAIKYNDTKTSYHLQTYTNKFAAQSDGAYVTHHGQCGTCSTLQDLAVYLRQRDLTAPVRRCGTMSIIKPLAMNCLKTLGFTSACAETWYYNAKFTAQQCAGTCLVSWLKGEPSNKADGSLNECLACDETKSGPVFQFVAGRTRRNSGIISSIGRGSDEVYPVVHNY